MLIVAFTLERSLTLLGAANSISVCSTIDAFWDTTFECLAKSGAEARYSTVDYLVGLSTNDPSRNMLVYNFFDRAITHAENNQEVYSMFVRTIEGLGVTWNQQSIECFAEVGASYVKSLSGVSDDSVVCVAREALQVSLRSQVFAPFLADLAALATQRMSFSKLCESDLQLVRSLEESLRITQRSSFSGNVALLALAVRLKQEAETGRAENLDRVLLGLEGRLYLDGFEKREVKEYVKIFSKYAVRAIQTLSGYEKLFNAINVTDEGDLIVFEELYDQALKLYVKHDSIDSLLALNVFAVLNNSGSCNKVCCKHLGSLKTEKILDKIDPKTQNMIRQEFGRDPELQFRWKKIVESAVKKSNNSIMNRFRR